MANHVGDDAFAGRSDSTTLVSVGENYSGIQNKKVSHAIVATTKGYSFVSVWHYGLLLLIHQF
ncbi:uncharacterized protein ASCRUDRAFT_78230 [Ascoidea rubescens DSM 1968]|uniref:Uncharacterized protein n=1 Tax=Ascoidea rubescens DSM 1968 TaxID=1344418 RepID=A0A1D2V8M2_9ASCO|nr:hypothetical protein ASCRUDRAFT_78230 [Ascoidea rubescens DSM 1968]ODV57980.1 hypothetical protein ASCRUDRAFT_78230 [Ascoidea rubescens DSM 1968]